MISNYKEKDSDALFLPRIIGIVMRKEFVTLGDLKEHPHPLTCLDNQRIA
ncbi:hypothetical protein [Maribacter sp. 4U21]|nr:hypothetical protein [Maribacter sp. 4U21]